MAIYNEHTFGLKVNPPPPPDMRFTLEFSPLPLLQLGFNIAVEISTASIFKSPPLNMPISSIVVMAHFDTGASSTSIDIELAKHLSLLAVGQSENRTASGPQIMPNFAIDISFPAAKLSPFYNLRVGSCRLGFDLASNMKLPNAQNMGVLIGRDIMSRWNIVWNGPSSTVIISD